MELADLLFSQGFGTRRVCHGLVQAGLVDWRIGEQAEWQRADDALMAIEAVQLPQLQLRVQGQEWPFHAKAYLLLHKPAGTECSAKPSAYPSIYTLLPAPLRQRPVKGGKPGVQAIGRLDQDTTGLLLLSDDGTFIHRMSSPKHRVPKVYEVHARHAFTEAQVAELLAGVVLHDSNERVQADACVLRTPNHLSMALHAGKYHQVKRMVAAVGNRVDALHRSRIGGLALPQDLAPGQWRWLNAHDLAALDESPALA